MEISCSTMTVVNATAATATPSLKVAMLVGVEEGRGVEAVTSGQKQESATLYLSQHVHHRKSRSWTIKTKKDLTIRRLAAAAWNCNSSRMRPSCTSIMTALAVICLV